MALLDVTFDLAMEKLNNLLERLVNALSKLKFDSKLNLEGIETITLVGKNGKSNFEIWKALGNEGTEEDFLNTFMIDLKVNEINLTTSMLNEFNEFELKDLKVGQLYKFRNIESFKSMWLKFDSYKVLNGVEEDKSYYLCNQYRGYDDNDVCKDNNYIIIRCLKGNYIEIVDKYYKIRDSYKTENYEWTLWKEYKNNKLKEKFSLTTKVRLYHSYGNIKVLKSLDSFGLGGLDLRNHRFNEDERSYIQNVRYFREPTKYDKWNMYIYIVDTTPSALDYMSELMTIVTEI